MSSFLLRRRDLSSRVLGSGLVSEMYISDLLRVLEGVPLLCGSFV